jgi:hypothetical protein
MRRILSPGATNTMHGSGALTPAGTPASSASHRGGLGARIVALGSVTASAASVRTRWRVPSRPKLGQLKPADALVVRQVTNRGGGMWPWRRAVIEASPLETRTSGPFTSTKGLEEGVSVPDDAHPRTLPWTDAGSRRTIFSRR